MFKILGILLAGFVLLMLIIFGGPLLVISAAVLGGFMYYNVANGWSPPRVQYNSYSGKPSDNNGSNR